MLWLKAECVFAKASTDEPPDHLIDERPDRPINSQQRSKDLQKPQAGAVAAVEGGEVGGEGSERVRTSVLIRWPNFPGDTPGEFDIVGPNI